MEIDKEPSYSKDFIKNNVFIVGNEISQKCNCTKIELPKKDDDDDGVVHQIHSPISNSEPIIFLSNIYYDFFFNWQTEKKSPVLNQ